MASRCCGSRLSLPNQYDTKTPRASLLVCGRQGAALFFRAVRRPSRDSPGTASRHESKHSVGLENILGKIPNFSKRKISKIPSELPTAGPRLPNLGESQCQRNTRGGQAASRTQGQVPFRDRKSTRLNSSHPSI